MHGHATRFDGMSSPAVPAFPSEHLIHGGSPMYAADPLGVSTRADSARVDQGLIPDQELIRMPFRKKVGRSRS